MRCFVYLLLVCSVIFADVSVYRPLNYFLAAVGSIPLDGDYVPYAIVIITDHGSVVRLLWVCVRTIDNFRMKKNL